MKFILLSVIFCLSAQASFFAITCSDSKGMFKYQHGHIPTKMSVSYLGGNGVAPELFEFKITDYVIEVLEEKEISKEQKKFCEPGRTAGYMTWENISYKKMKITLQSDVYPQSVLNTSEDKKSLVVKVICVNEGNSRTSCN